MQEASSGQLVSGGAGGRLLVSGLRHSSKKISCDDPFQTIPGSIPGSCIPAFTGTRVPTTPPPCTILFVLNHSMESKCTGTEIQYIHFHTSP